MSRHSLADSWGMVDHSTSATDSDADEDLYESEENTFESTSRATALRNLQAAKRTTSETPSKSQGRRSSRSTPSRQISNYATPQFIMPTPESTPIATRRQSKRKTPTPRKAQTPKHTPVRTKIKSPKRVGGEQSNMQTFLNTILPTLLFVASSVVDILGLVFYFLKIPLAIGIAVLVLRAMIEASLPSITLPSILNHIPMVPSTCSIPLLRNFVPSCLPPEDFEHPAAGSLKKFSTVHDSFEKVLDMGQLSVPLPMQMSHGEVMVLELRDLVHYQSKLPSKPELIAEIESYVQQSKEVSRQLTDFSSHINRAVDRVIMTNRYALRELDTMKQQTKQIGQLANMLPWWPFSKSITAGDIIDQYLEHATVVEEEADALLVEANTISLHLQNMEDSLEMMRQSASRDLAGFDEKRDELFAKLWTKLGGNAKDRKHIQKNIGIAKRIGGVTKDARLLVSQVQTELRAVKNDVEDLRSRMAGPRNRASMNTADIEEHIRYVTDAYTRLDVRRKDARQHRDAAVKGILEELKQKVWNRPEHERVGSGQTAKELPAK